MCLLQPPGYQKRDKRETLPYWVDVQIDLLLVTRLIVGFAMHWLKIIWFATQETGSYGIRGHESPDQGFLSLSRYAVVNDSVSGQGSPWSHCTLHMHIQSFVANIWHGGHFFALVITLKWCTGIIVRCEKRRSRSVRASKFLSVELSHNSDPPSIPHDDYIKGWNWDGVGFAEFWIYETFLHMGVFNTSEIM